VMVLVIVPVPVVLMMLVMLVSGAMLTGFFVMVVMVFVYHRSVYFPKAKVRRPACNRVAIFAGIG